MNKNAATAPSQPMTADATPQELQAWADEAQACIDSGEVIISDHRKAHATVVALRSHASLRSQVSELRDALKFARNRIVYLGTVASERHDAANEKEFLPVIDAALALNSQHSDGEAG